MAEDALARSTGAEIAVDVEDSTSSSRAASEAVRLGARSLFSSLLAGSTWAAVAGDAALAELSSLAASDDETLGELLIGTDSAADDADSLPGMAEAEFDVAAGH